MNVEHNKSVVPCPNCQLPIKRKDYHASLRRCRVSGVYTCETCRIGDVSLDVFVGRRRNAFVFDYLKDKYVGVRT